MVELLLGTAVMYCGNHVEGIKVELHMFLNSVPDDGI
jgi:hypothetical protein